MHRNHYESIAWQKKSVLPQGQNALMIDYHSGTSMCRIQLDGSQVVAAIG